jgi:hypothetical protein
LEFVFLTVASFRAHGGLLVGSRDNLGRKRQITAKVFNTFVSQVAVVVLPRESDADVSLGFKGLHEHDNLEVGGSLNVRVGGRLGVLLHDTDSLLEEVREDSNAIFLWDKHDQVLFKRFKLCRSMLVVFLVSLKHEKRKMRNEVVVAAIIIGCKRDGRCGAAGNQSR